MRHLLLLYCLLMFPCVAQLRGDWAPDSPYGQQFDPNSIEKVTGKVVKVEPSIPRPGMGDATHLILQTDNETLTVHLGPSWYVENQEIQIANGDTVTVTGSRITADGAPAIIATSVQRDNYLLTLRDKNGIPMWSAWKRLPRSQ